MFFEKFRTEIQSLHEKIDLLTKVIIWLSHKIDSLNTNSAIDADILNQEIEEAFIIIESGDFEAGLQKYKIINEEFNRLTSENREKIQSKLENLYL